MHVRPLFCGLPNFRTSVSCCLLPKMRIKVVRPCGVPGDIGWLSLSAPSCSATSLRHIIVSWCLFPPHASCKEVGCGCLFSTSQRLTQISLTPGPLTQPSTLLSSPTRVGCRHSDREEQGLRGLSPNTKVQSWGIEQDLYLNMSQQIAACM